MPSSSTHPKKILLVGGGHTHALVLHALKTNPLTGIDLTVINIGKTAPYSGMLPGFVAGHYELPELEIDLERLSRLVGATLIDGRAVAMNPEKKAVTLEDGSELSFDLASVDVGINTRMPTLPGFAEHAVPAKPLADFAAAWDQYRSASGQKAVVIIGGGIAGAELAMAMSFALRKHSGVSVTVIDRGKVLSTNSAPAKRHVLRALVRNNVHVMEHAEIVSVTDDGVTLNDGSSVAANFIVGAAGATPHVWVKNTGLKLHEGFIIVDRHLETDTPGIFAVGDCAHLAFDPRPKAGVFAVRQAPILLENLRRSLTGQPFQTYEPQTDYLKLVSLGKKSAFGEKLGWSLSGRLVWWLKDRIDRGFMKQFS